VVLVSFLGVTLHFIVFAGLGLGFDTWNTYLSHGGDYEELSRDGTASQPMKQSVNTLMNRWLAWQTLDKR